MRRPEDYDPRWCAETKGPGGIVCTRPKRHRGQHGAGVFYEYDPDMADLDGAQKWGDEESGSERTLVAFRDAEGDQWYREADGTFTLTFGDGIGDDFYSHLDLEEILDRPHWMPLSDKVYAEVQDVERPNLDLATTQQLLEELARRIDA